MDSEQLFQEVENFSKEGHGSSSYDKDKFFVKGKKENEFAPLSFLVKKLGFLENEKALLANGFLLDSYDLFEEPGFASWFENQFGRKLGPSVARKISILKEPNNKEIFDAIASVNKGYEVLRREQIIINGKKLPVQLGEWYAKIIFGLRQKKSASQRGFDFFLDGKRVEVKVYWADKSSLKGVKVRKSLVDLSEYCILIYLGQNFMIREVCFLDASFVIRKFGGKGHTIFLKDSDVSGYFFSKSGKHADKVSNRSALLKYSNPTLAMKIAD